MNNRRVLSVVVLIGLLVIPSSTLPVQADSGNYELIDVNTAQTMITSGQHTDLLILDVRSKVDYDMSHLYDAVSLPFEQIESRIDELSGLEQTEIIVYCKSGLTSQMAAEILVIHGYTKVSSIVGGIISWLDAGYSIWTASHYVSVGPGSSISMEPLLAYLTTVSIPPTQSNCTVQGFNATTDFDSVIIEQNETCTVELVTIEINGTNIESIRITNRIWEFTETGQNMNRSIAFVSIKVNVSGVEMLVYRLQYLIDHIDYTLQLDTTLTPLDSGSYNRSITHVIFTPVENPDIVSIEGIEFQNPSKLSKIYSDIAHVVHKIGQDYCRSDDDYLRTLGSRYRIIRQEIQVLSLLIETGLSNYDHTIMESVAIIIDACTLGCWLSAWGNCYGSVGELTIYCIGLLFVLCIGSGPLFGFCIEGGLGVCGILDLLLAVYCGIFAYNTCCSVQSGCPILTVYNGNEYVSEGLLDIHSEMDITRTFHLNIIPVSLDNRYLMRLTEHPQTRSHLDQIRLFARISDGWIVELSLVSAIHVTEGNVLMQLNNSDDVRVDVLGANFNGGTSQYIDLQFMVPEGFTAVQFMIVLEGYNVDVKE